MKELTIEQTKEVSGGAVPLIILFGDFAMGIGVGAALRKLYNQYVL